MIEARPVPKKKTRSISWNSREGRSVIYQIVAIASIAGFLWLLVTNTLENMRRRGIQSGYDFMSQPFGFDVSETLIPYDVMSTYWTAFGIGLANTLKVAIIGIVLATLLGTLLGIGRFSTNFLVRKICYVYVEIFRNIPVYLQLLIWYIVFTETLPAFDDAWEIGNTFLSKGGFAFPWPVWKLGQSLALVGVLLGLVGSYFYAQSARRHFDKTGQRRPVLPVDLGHHHWPGGAGLAGRWGAHRNGACPKKAFSRLKVVPNSVRNFSRCWWAWCSTPLRSSLKSCARALPRYRWVSMKPPLRSA